MTNNTEPAPRQPQRRHPRTLPPRRRRVRTADWPCSHYQPHIPKPAPALGESSGHPPCSVKRNCRTPVSLQTPDFRPPLFRQKKEGCTPLPLRPTVISPVHAQPLVQSIFIFGIPQSKIRNPQSEPPLESSKKKRLHPLSRCMPSCAQSAAKESGGCRISDSALRM